jgi:hypothetical protein
MAKANEKRNGVMSAAHQRKWRQWLINGWRKSKAGINNQAGSWLAGVMANEKLSMAWHHQ